MDLLRMMVTVCLVLCLLANSILASPLLRSDVSADAMSEADQMMALSDSLPNVLNSLSRKRRSFAQYHQGRQHYYTNPRASRRFERRFRSRRRHRLHHRGAGQIVYE